jgi:uncharacterized protein
MALFAQIEADLIAALKARDSQRVDVLRFTKSAIKNAAIAKRSELTDVEVEKVLSSELKRREEAATQFRAGGREDLSAADSAAAEILRTYLPKALTEEELTAIVKQKIAVTGAKGSTDFGKVMGQVMAEVGTRADGKVVQSLVKQFLSS